MGTVGVTKLYSPTRFFSITELFYVEFSSTDTLQLIDMGQYTRRYGLLDALIILARHAWLAYYRARLC